MSDGLALFQPCQLNSVIYLLINCTSDCSLQHACLHSQLAGRKRVWLTGLSAFSQPGPCWLLDVRHSMCMDVQVVVWTTWGILFIMAMLTAATFNFFPDHTSQKSW